MRLFVAILLPATVRQQLFKGSGGAARAGEWKLYKREKPAFDAGISWADTKSACSGARCAQVQEAALELQFEGVGAFGDLFGQA